MPTRARTTAETVSMMRAMTRLSASLTLRSSVVALAMLAIGSHAEAQRVSPDDDAPMSPAFPPPHVIVRDGDTSWTVRRDERDARRVTVSRADGASFRARIDRHALVRVSGGRDARETLRALGLIPVRELSRAIGAWRVVDAGDGDGLDVAARLARFAGPGLPLRDAIPEWILLLHARAISIPPNDERYPGQWYLERIDIEDAWQLATGNASTTIVVIDSGCDGTHPDLVPNLDPGRDVIDGDDDPTPSAMAGSEHGTACAGLVAAAGDNAIGIAGTCPECRVRCVRLLDGGATEVPLGADIEAFQFALDVDAAVVSNSWGFVDPTPIPAMLRAIIEAVVDSGRGGLGALVLFASGNDDRELFDYEIEAVRGVITVGAVNNFDEATAYSNRGESLDVVAPTGTLTTDIAGAGGGDPGDYTSSFGGTSSACPVAAGVAGLLASAAPDSTGAELADALISTALRSPFATPDDRGHDLVYGYGRIAPAAALRRALGLPDPLPDAGMPDAGTIDGIDAGTASPPASGCGCRVGTGAPRSGLALFALAGLALAIRSRSRASRRAATAPV